MSQLTYIAHIPGARERAEREARYYDMMRHLNREMFSDGRGAPHGPPFPPLPPTEPIPAVYGPPKRPALGVALKIAAGAQKKLDDAEREWDCDE